MKSEKQRQSAIFYILLAVCIAAGMLSLAIFVPQVRELIISLGEKYVGRPLTHEVWHKRFISWGMSFLVSDMVLAFIVWTQSGGSKAPMYNFQKAHNLKTAVIFCSIPFFVSVIGGRFFSGVSLSFRGIVCCISAGLFLIGFYLFVLNRDKFDGSPKLQNIAIALTGIFSAVFILCCLDGGNGWGGDFSEYIAQARAVVTGTIGEQVKNNSYIIEHSTPLGDAVYPWGFPVLLAPFYALFGKDLFFLKFPGMICFSVSVVFCLLLFRKHFSFFQAELSALVFTLFVVVSPATRGIYNSPLSDIPFLCFSLITLYFYDGLFYSVDKRRQTIGGVGGGIFAFLAFMTRTNGIVFPCLLVAMHVLCLLTKSRRIKCALTKLHIKEFVPLYFPAHVLPYALFVLLCMLQNALLPLAGMTHVGFLSGISFASVMRNAVYYVLVFREFFPVGAVFLHAWLMPLFLYGFIRYLFRQPLLSMYVLGSMGILVLWPFSQGIRFCIPVIPVMIVFTGDGARSFVRLFVNKDSIEQAAVFLEVAAVLVCIGIFQVLPKGEYEYGAYSSDAKEMYAVIESQTEKNAKIIFFKPRVLYLETGRLGFTTNDIGRFSDADYLLLSRDGYGTFDYDIEGQYPAESKKLKMIFENDTLKLYKILSSDEA